jgi:hypothetical protein
MITGSWPRRLLFVALLATGAGYIAIYAFFVVRSENFIIAQDNRKAAEYGRQHPAPLPVTWKFGNGSPDNARLGFGWRTPFPVGAWMAVNDAWIAWVPVRRDVDLILDFNVAVLTTPAAPENRVEISVNGRTLGSWERGGSSARSPIEVRVPSALLSEGACRLRIHIDHVKAMYRPDVGVARNGQELVLTDMAIREATDSDRTP